jgi:hypothetical protein
MAVVVLGFAAFVDGGILHHAAVLNIGGNEQPGDAKAFTHDTFEVHFFALPFARGATITPPGHP